MISTDLLIRQANISDAAEIMALIHRAMSVYAINSGITEVLESQRESLDDIKKSIENHYVMIAENRDSIAGTVRLIYPAESIRQFGTTADTMPDPAWFSRFAVLPELHATGAGKLLFQAAEDYLRDIGAGSILLFTALSNKRLVSFYQARGFTLLSSEDSHGYKRGLFGKKLI